MVLNDEVRYFQVTKALPSGMIKTASEYEALAFLKYSFPDFFSGLHKAEAPDLQDSEGELGVEVTRVEAPNHWKITGESKRYYHAKTDGDKKKAFKKILECGGDIDKFSITYPTSTAENDMEIISNVFRKKLKKVYVYRKEFQSIGLAIIIDTPLSFLADLNWEKRLTEINDDNFDFIVFIH